MAVAQFVRIPHLILAFFRAHGRRCRSGKEYCASLGTSDRTLLRRYDSSAKVPSWTILNFEIIPARIASPPIISYWSWYTENYTTVSLISYFLSLLTSRDTCLTVLHRTIFVIIELCTVIRLMDIIYIWKVV